MNACFFNKKKKIFYNGEYFSWNNWTVRAQQVGLFKASSEKAAGDGSEGEGRGEGGESKRRKLRHTGRVIYCNEDLWRQI